MNDSRDPRTADSRDPRTADSRDPRTADSRDPRTARPLPRSWLFTPGTLSAHFDAARQAGADAAILDLEDAVAPRDKGTARRSALKYLASAPPSAVATALRINPPATLPGWQDLTALLESAADPDFVLIPKAESAAVAALVSNLLREAGKSTGVVVLAESAAAAARPHALLDRAVVDAVLFGAADMCADLGADPDAAVTSHARSTLLTAAAAAGIPVVDAPYFDVDGAGGGDLDAANVASRRAAAEGFAGKAAIHPRHVSAINAAFSSTRDQIDWANRVLDANDRGTGTVDGVMIDEAVARRARRILDRAPH